MDKYEVLEVMQCAPLRDVPFYYFKDKYALELLRQRVGEGVPVREVKQSQFGPLLDKAVVREVTAQLGGSTLNGAALASAWRVPYQAYSTRVIRWGSPKKWCYGYDQISRAGMNIVLQLNFSHEHNREYERLIQPGEERPFCCYGHPVAQAHEKRQTLAWARIDLNLNDGEALIEEIQTDWIRYALWANGRVSWRARRGADIKNVSEECAMPGINCSGAKLAYYVDHVLKPHCAIWDEAVLTAAICFIKNELGCQRIFYHTAETGWWVKRIDGDKPPRSLYSKLPRKFCFQKTKEAPLFLQRAREGYLRDLMKRGIPSWYLLEI